MNKEQLELAAKACGISTDNIVTDDKEDLAILTNKKAYWRPLTDQADSDRMACKLRISTRIHDTFIYCFKYGYGGRSVGHNGTDEDVCCAVREARLLVAAEIGRSKCTS